MIEVRNILDDLTIGISRVVLPADGLSCTELGVSNSVPLRPELGSFVFPHSRIQRYVDHIPVSVRWYPIGVGPLAAQRTPHLEAVFPGFGPPIINMPTLEYFADDEACMHALLHETAHWAHFYQLGFIRQMMGYGPSPGIRAYAELVADTAALIASVRLGCSPMTRPIIDRTAGYIKYWLQWNNQYPQAIAEATIIARAMEQVLPKWDTTI